MVSDKMEIIKSKNNPKVKYWTSLLNKKGRQQTKQYIIEGVKLIEEALLANQVIESIILAEYMQLPDKITLHITNAKGEIELFSVSKEIIDKLADTNTPQGILAVVKQKDWQIEELLKKKGMLLLIDEIQDPGNLGTIIRSANGAGVDGVIIGIGTVELYSPKVIRSAMGSIFHLPIISADLDDVIKHLKADGIKVIGTSPYTDQIYYDVDLTNNVAILIGNEAKGLSEHRKEQVNEMMKIPLTGEAESLNAAMATTIILFDRVRQLANKLS